MLVYYHQWWFGSCSDTHRCYQVSQFQGCWALKSSLIGLFEKHRAWKFFIYVQDYEDNDPKSHEGLDLIKVTTREVIAYVFD